MYTNYKFCTPRGNRCAVYARPTGVGLKRTEIFILECSRRDSFSRRKAREAYQNWKASGDCYYTTLEKEVRRTEEGNFLNHKAKVHQCHPLIVSLPVEFSNEAVTKYLESFLKRFMHRSKAKELFNLFLDSYTEEGYYIEQ